MSTSDHLQLVVELNKQVYAPKSRRFKFENIWIKESDCYNLINESWNAIENSNIMEKI